jgi:hypothetical protein
MLVATRLIVGVLFAAASLLLEGWRILGFAVTIVPLGLCIASGALSRALAFAPTGRFVGACE